MRKSLLFVALGACLVLALSASAAVPADQAPTAQPAPAAAVAPATVPAPASGLCLQGEAILPVAQAGGQTCAFCTAKCEDRAQHCYEHCKDPRSCTLDCDEDYYFCIADCPC